MMRKAVLVALEEIFQEKDFVATPAVIVAVSGGSDSMALLLLVHAWLEKIKKPPRLIAVTVDHGLRPEAKEEARTVAAFCACQNIEHEIVCWQGEKPGSGLMERARMARYQLLYQSACRHQAKAIFTGHNFDDVAETYLMRAARTRHRQQIEQFLKSVKRFSDKNYCENKGLYQLGEPSETKTALMVVPRGLAAIARQSLLFEKIRLIRPLLAVRRTTLRAFLEKNAVHWIDDPSNEDTRFERVRLRQNMDEKTRLAAAESAKQAATCRQIYHDDALKFLQKHTICRLGELYQMDLDKGERVEDFLPQLLADFACLVGGGGYLRTAPPSFLAWLQNDAEARFTWGGSIIEKQGTRLRLWRERRNLPTTTLPPRHSTLWDGRYHITNNSAADIVIRPAERQEVAEHFRAKTRVLVLRRKMRKNKELEHFAEQSEAKNVLDAAHALNLALHYFLATPAIIYSNIIELPRLNSSNFHHGDIVFKRILAPFHFLQSESEGDLISHWQRIFNSKS